MFLVRNVFNVKPGQGKNMVEAFKKAMPHLQETGLVKNTRIMTDAVADFWTVVLEQEVEDLNAYLNMSKSLSGNAELRDVVKTYTEATKTGRREIFKIE